jgi:hypothetical protein
VCHLQKKGHTEEIQEKERNAKTPKEKERKWKTFTA